MLLRNKRFLFRCLHTVCIQIMLLEGKGSAACLVSSIEPEENGGKNTVLS